MRRGRTAGAITWGLWHGSSALNLEKSIVSAVRERFANLGDMNDKDLIGAQIQRVVLGRPKLVITVKTNDATGKPNIFL